MIVSDPAVKQFTKVFGDALQLEESDFNITVDNAQDYCDRTMALNGYPRDWCMSADFSTEIGMNQYRANDTFTKIFARIWLSHALLAKVERDRMDTVMVSIFEDLM
jgi:hypothetical protein